MKKRFLYLLLPIVTLILEVLPYGAVCNFMLPSVTEGVPAGRFRELYSYFDLMPFGYANFAPLITAVFTCLITVLLVFYCITGKIRIAAAAKNLSDVCVVFSLGPVTLGFHFLSIVGILITLCLIGETLLLRSLLKGASQNDNSGICH